MKNIKYVVKWIGFIGFFIALFVLTIAANKKRKQTPTSAIRVQFMNPELHFLEENDIKASLVHKIDTAEGIVLRELELGELERDIEQNVYVEKCNVFINNNEVLNFEIEQKQPLYRVIHENSVSYYVDKQGIKFPLSTTFTANVPIATGKIIYEVDETGVQQGKAINDLVTFFNYLKTNELANVLVTRVDVQPNGDFIFTPRTGNHLVNIGSIENLEDKFSRLQIFYKEGLNKVGWDKYSSVSVKFKDQIIAKKK